MAIPDWAKYLAGILLVVLIFAGAIFINKDAEFGGADDAGEAAIMEISPDYEPWFSPIWEPKPETESMLFALQAGIGAGVVGYFIGYERARQKFQGKGKKD